MPFGEFIGINGRPYLKGRLILPRLRLAAEITFCIDTGADESTIMPEDEDGLGLDYSRLCHGAPTAGIGGISQNYRERIWLTFRDNDQAIHAFTQEIMIAAPQPGLSGIPSILGRDILNRMQMTYDYPASELIETDTATPLWQRKNTSSLGPQHKETRLSALAPKQAAAMHER